MDEPAYPPVFAALANALYQARGKGITANRLQTIYN